MAFTYVGTLATDLDLIRFHLSDTDSTAAMFTDEEINGALALHGTVGATVIFLIKNLIARVSKPNYRADWLQVDNRAAVQSLRELLTEKQKEFSIATYSATVEFLWRVDSDMTDAPDYEGET